MRFERTLPNAVRFGGSLTRRDAHNVEMELFIDNQSNEPMQQITLQTCAFLRNTFEFSAYSQANKFVHVPGQGWRRFDDALAGEPRGKYRLGWRGGPPVADKPVLVTQGRNPNRLLAMTWFEDTLSLVGNPAHPCMHADPVFPDFAPGRMHTLHGRLTFFEGPLEEFDLHR